MDLAITYGLRDSNEKHEDMVVEWLLCGGDGSKLDVGKRKKPKGCTSKRCFVYQDRDAGEKCFFSMITLQTIQFLMMPHFDTNTKCKEIFSFFL